MIKLLADREAPLLGQRFYSTEEKASILCTRELRSLQFIETDIGDRPLYPLEFEDGIFSKKSEGVEYRVFAEYILTVAGREWWFAVNPFSEEAYQFALKQNIERLTVKRTED